MMNNEPRAVVSGEYHCTDLTVSGYPRLPNQHGSGNLSPDRVALQYGPGDRIRATVHGPWVPDDESARTDERVTSEYDTSHSDLSDWPDWLADLTRVHNPSPTKEERAARMLRLAERRESQDKPRAAVAARRTADDILREPDTQAHPYRYTTLAGPR